MSGETTRRSVIGGLGATALAAPAIARAKPSVVVIGGGFGGVAAARVLARRGMATTLVEPVEHYATCPSSNAVIAGLRPYSSIVFGYDGVRRAGVTVRHETALAIDGQARRVRLSGGDTLAYDRLIVSPGVAMRLDAVPGYDASATERMPHAWKAGAQTELLGRQLAAMEDGGLVVISAPALPYRCPPGPYERASLIAHFLKTRKPRSKLILLDEKDKFSKQPLFEAAWKALYPNLEWVPAAKGGGLTGVDADAMEISTKGAGRFKAAVASIVPPQHAPALCFESGLADAYGWCRIEPIAFESIRVPGIHVIGDASAAGAMPKSAFSADAQAKVCAQAVVDLLSGTTPETPKLINACYSLVAPDAAISIANVYEVEWDMLVSMPGIGGSSPTDAKQELRAKEAAYGAAWYRTITGELFG